MTQLDVDNNSSIGPLTRLEIFSARPVPLPIPLLESQFLSRKDKG